MAILLLSAGARSGWGYGHIAAECWSWKWVGVMAILLLSAGARSGWGMAILLLSAGAGSGWGNGYSAAAEKASFGRRGGGVEPKLFLGAQLKLSDGAGR